MSVLRLTVEVLNLSPIRTSAEVETFFSYCGNVDKVRLHRNEDQSQYALVTFRQPFAFQTALLMNEATIDGDTIRVLPSKNPTLDHPISHELSTETKKNQWHDLVQPRRKNLNMMKLVDRTWSSIYASVMAARNIFPVIWTISSSIALILFLSSLLYNLSKHAIKVGTTSEERFFFI